MWIYIWVIFYFLGVNQKVKWSNIVHHSDYLQAMALYNLGFIDFVCFVGIKV